MVFLFLKKNLIMSKSTIAIILVYILGIIFGALALDMWSAETGPKVFVGIVWTAILLITLHYTEMHETK